MKKNLIILLFIIASLSVAITSFAHSGRTDSRGGHYNRSTGEYHYHHGYPEHSHPGGICPYENKSTTREDTTTTSESKKRTEKSLEDAEPDEEQHKSLQKYGFWLIVIIVVLSAAAMIYIFFFLLK